MDLSVEQIRVALKSLREVKLVNSVPKHTPKLCDGIVWIGPNMIHPASFLDMFGAEELRAMKRDISAKQLEKFIKRWEKKNANRKSSI